MMDDSADDRKIERRNNLKKKKGLKKTNISDEYKAKNKIKNEIKNKKLNMIEEELWEDWENQLRDNY